MKKDGVNYKKEKLMKKARRLSRKKESVLTHNHKVPASRPFRSTG
jgi:hypothetical protein